MTSNTSTVSFKCGRTSVANVPIPGHPLSSIDDATIQQIETAILEDPRVTEGQLIHEVKISVVSVEKNPWPYAHGKDVCSMDSMVAHTFTEARTDQVC